MDSLIPLSHLNDAVFCVKSIYYHGLYGTFEKSTYQSTDQTEGTQAHEAIDEDAYSSSLDWLAGIPVTSLEYGISGKIDLYNTRTKLLVERKRTCIKIYDGQKYQLYGQMLCLQEMGYEVEKIAIHSLTDNKRHFLPLPDATELQKFRDIIALISSFDPLMTFTQNPAKCARCIYRELCDTYLSNNL